MTEDNDITDEDLQKGHEKVMDALNRSVQEQFKKNNTDLIPESGIQVAIIGAPKVPLDVVHSADQIKVLQERLQSVTESNKKLTEDTFVQTGKINDQKEYIEDLEFHLQFLYDTAVDAIKYVGGKTYKTKLALDTLENIKDGNFED